MVTKRSSAVNATEVLREFPPIGKYRIRLLSAPQHDVAPVLDIREYVSAETFEGFTRRGIQLSVVQILDLRDILKEVLERGSHGSGAPGPEGFNSGRTGQSGSGPAGQSGFGSGPGQVPKS